MRRRYVVAAACLAHAAFIAWGTVFQSNYGPLPTAVYVLAIVWGAALIAITLWALRRW